MTLYSVILFSHEKEIYANIEHNLSKPDARAHMRSLRLEKLPAFIIKQGTFTHPFKIEECKRCKDQLLKLQEKRSKENV
jgi:hypothetical protein